jgi:hypothetical protein
VNGSNSSSSCCAADWINFQAVPWLLNIETFLSLLDQEQAKPLGHCWGFAACDETDTSIGLWCSAIEHQSWGSGNKQRLGSVYAWRNGPARKLRRKLLMACW